MLCGRRLRHALRRCGSHGCRNTPSRPNASYSGSLSLAMLTVPVCLAVPCLPCSYASALQALPVLRVSIRPQFVLFEEIRSSNHKTIENPKEQNNSGPERPRIPKCQKITPVWSPNQKQNTAAGIDPQFGPRNFFCLKKLTVTTPKPVFGQKITFCLKKLTVTTPKPVFGQKNTFCLKKLTVTTPKPVFGQKNHFFSKI